MAIFIISLVIIAFASLLTLSTSTSPPVIKLAPVYGDEGEFIVNLAIGTPPSNFSLRLDTTTDLIWAAKCKKSSTSYSRLACSSGLCKAATGFPTCNNKNDGCKYEYHYTSNRTVQVDLDTETFTFEKNVRIPNLVFACGIPENKEAGGLGLGRGPISLVSQLNATGFSYCLPSYDSPNKTGVVLFGSQVKTKGETVIARLARSPKRNPSPQYIVLEGISVGHVLLDIKKSTFEVDRVSGNGGVVVDTGSTLTYLKGSVFDKVTDEVKRQIRVATTNAFDHDIQVPLSLCFVVPSNFSKRAFVFPRITFHFDKRNRLTLPVGNSYREYFSQTTNRSISCLAMAAAPPSDLVKDTVAFTPNAACDEM